MFSNAHIIVTTTELLLRSGGKWKGSHLNHHHVSRVSRMTVSLSEMRTLSGTFSSDPSVEFRISIASGMPTRKTQTPKYVSNMVFHLFPCTNRGGILIGYLLNSPIFILFQPAEKSYLASMTVDMVIDKEGAQGKPKIVLVRFYSIVITNTHWKNLFLMDSSFTTTKGVPIRQVISLDFE